MSKIKQLSLLLTILLALQLFFSPSVMIAETYSNDSQDESTTVNFNQNIESNQGAHLLEQGEEIISINEEFSESNEFASEIIEETFEKETSKKLIELNNSENKDENKQEEQTNTIVESELEQAVDQAEEDLNLRQENSIVEMNFNNIPGQYYTDPNAIVVPTQLIGQSTNVHTKPHMLWVNESRLYLAVKSTHTLQYMMLNSTQNIGSQVYNPWVSIFIDDIEYKPEGLTGNTKDAHWTVYEFNIADLNLRDNDEHPFFVKGIGGGHDLNSLLSLEIPKTSIEARKVWVGGTERPEVTLQLLAEVENGQKKLIGFGKVNGTEIPAWSYTWLDVVQYDPYGRKYTFTVDEEIVPINNHKSIDGLTVTNTYSPEVINITVNKEWIGPATENVTIILYAEGVDTGKMVNLSKENNWSASFPELNKYDDETGSLINYTVEEVPIPGYSTEKYGSIEDGFTFININEGTFDIPVEKTWIGPAKEAVTITLFRDGEAIKEMILNEENAWSGSFNNLRKYNENTGEKIIYTVEEVLIPGYSSDITGSADQGFLVKNTNDTTIDINVEKRWVGSITGPVTIRLLGNGIDTGKTLVLSEENMWSDDFLNVRKYDATTGEKITYTVEELDVPDNYEVSIEEKEGNFIVTNTALFGSLKIEKVDEKGHPLTGAIFELRDANGNVIARLTTDSTGVINFENLLWGEYKLVEIKAPDGYKKLVKEIDITIDEENLYVVKEITNIPIGWEIPNTGGAGTLKFYGLGVLLMGIALSLFTRKYT